MVAVSATDALKWTSATNGIFIPFLSLLTIIGIPFATVIVYLKTDLKLKILVPEDLNYEHAFDDIFEKHGVKAHLDKVRTADFGTIYELIYHLKVNKDFSQKAFIDDIRTRNGNLNIALTLSDADKNLNFNKSEYDTNSNTGDNKVPNNAITDVTPTAFLIKTLPATTKSNSPINS